MKTLNLIFVMAVFCHNFVFGQDSKITKNDSIKNPIEYIKKETIGGKLDYSKMLVGYGAKDAKYKTYLYSIAMWTHAVKDMGISRKKDIIKLWEEIYKRKMTTDEKKAVIMGLKEE